RQAAEQRLTALWQPVFFHVLENIPIQLPAISAANRSKILVIWIHMTELVTGEARQRLRQLALDLEFDRTAGSMLGNHRMRDRLIATVALGRLQSNLFWGELAALVRDPHPVLSLLAVRSLLQIDPKRAAPILMYEMTFREDWPIRNVVAALSEIDTAALAPDILSSLRMAREESLPRLLRVAEMIDSDDLWTLLIGLLDAHQPSEILIAALKATRDPRNLDMVRALVAHPDWPVRAQVAATLGRLGLAEDYELLKSMLNNTQWWVRYRAATALVSIPAIPRPQLITLCENLEDHFASDILKQALAESAKRRLA
ncbi:MAG: hypothetical protein RIR18_1648, partial [Pseudomonadota bacterium]